MKKHLIIIPLAIVGLFLGTNGFAQEKKGPGVGDIEGQRMNAFMVEKIIGSKVINMKGETLGKIEDLVVDIDTGTIVYAVLESGGFFFHRGYEIKKHLLLKRTICQTWRICIGGRAFSSIMVSPSMNNRD
jgi:sporulation protein YlmC with PRC-barrel domain